MDPRTERLKALSGECGIDLIGIADLEVFEKIGRSVGSLCGDSPQAFSRYPASERFNVKEAWEDTKSIISFAVSYAPSEDTVQRKGNVRISKASWGRDYHDVLKEKAERLMECFTKLYPCRYRIHVDTGLLSDRALAYSAGLGFYGKNNFIISEHFGSFIFLGHILTDLQIPAEGGIREKLCGECTKCLDICPSGAYAEGRPVEYSKCISYLNQKGKPYSGANYIYGCDICQDVCPFNRGVPKDLHGEFKTELSLVDLPAEEVLAMEEDRFLRDYSKSALAWRGLKNLKKNCNTLTAGEGKENV